MYSQYIDPNAYAGQYGYVPHDSYDGPSQFSQFLWNMGQYGVGMISPLAGTALSMLGNLGSQWYQNHKQEQFYLKYMSPEARMAHMKAAGINPNSAAQGVSGSSAPQMNAAAPTSAFNGVGEQLGRSVNSALNADVLRTEAEKNRADATLTKSLDVKQNMENSRFMELQELTLNRMKQENRISTSTANMLAQDEYYHGAEAFEHFKQTLLASDQLSQQLSNMEQEFLNKCAEFQLLMVQSSKTQAEISEVWSRIGLNKAQIAKIGHEIDNIDANTALISKNIEGKEIENEILGLKRDYENYTMDVLSETGFDMKSTTNQNYLRLVALGKTDEAENLMNGVYDYSKGQYGSKSEQTRKWINTAVGGLATVAGAIMLFVPGLQGAGAVTAGIGVHKLTSGRQSNSRFAFDGEDYSHIYD